MYAAAKQPGNLSQSALSYLQSLEKATKALRQSQPASEKKSTGGQHSLLESSRLSSERGSLSSMISQLRNRTQKESTIDESDGDQSMSDHQSQGSGETPSIDSQSSAGGERIVFDFPYETTKEDNKRTDPLPKELPGLHVGRKSIHEIRELRSSIDHSLIKPPKLQRQQPRRFSINSYKEDSDPELHTEAEEGPKSTTSKPNVVKGKSPFRPAIESGSDLESIDFESSTIKGELSDPSTGSSTRQPSPPSASQSEQGKFLDSSSGNNRAMMKRQQKTEDFYSSSDEASMSAAKNEVKRKESSTRPRRRSKSRSRSASLTPPKPKVSDSPTKSLHHESDDRQKAPVVNEREFASRNSTPPSMSAVATAQRGAVERPASSLPRAATYATLAEHSTQTESRKESDSLPEYCSSNLHYVTRDVLKTHLQLLKEFNRLEFSSLQEWNAILDDVRQKYEGPSTEKLKAVVEKRMNKLNMEQV
ncbi:hypothetical protein ANCDUO_02590 [Ancylostoma duodenale]|uniref:Uncharacterized protein n=1 Tax=Ancylostoma duodenale TaxID=51022 RepID=A0A0C2DW11_9BILA|nr:hypothetical protein ANCDUO_02590 [Ancylostoma duodenale]